MKSAEFIQAAAELLGSLSGQGTAPSVQVSQVGLTPVEPQLDDESDTKTMVGPLQQKLELLKKAVDVSSYYDEGEPGYNPGAEADVTEPDEVENMKKLAGILHNAGDDTDDFEG